MTSLRRLWSAWRDHPETTLPMFMITTGFTAVILGVHASRAFTDLGGATVIRILGFAMAAGGILVLTGILRADPLLEPVGLSVAAVGCVLYGLGVIAGLGAGGLIAGQLALGLAVFFILRVLLVARREPPGS